MTVWCGKKLLPVLSLVLLATSAACGADSLENTAVYTNPGGSGSDSAGSQAAAGAAAGGAGSSAAGSGGAAGSTTTTCSQTTYANFGQSFISTYCAGCHGASVTGSARQNAPVNDVFDTQAQVQAATRDVTKEVVSMQTMPPATAALKPSAAERAQFGAWLACGAP